MDIEDKNQKRIEDALRELFKSKAELSDIKRKNIDKIVGNTLELKRQKQINHALDRSIEKIITQKSNKNTFTSFVQGVAKWQIAMMSLFAIIFVGASITLASPDVQKNLQNTFTYDKGKIEISSSINNATVYLRNKNEKEFKMSGQTKLILSDQLPGEYQFYLEKEGYKTSPIFEFKLNKSGYYNKTVELEESKTSTEKKLLEYTNTEAGIYLKYPEGATLNYEKFNDGSFKLTIKTAGEIFSLSSQEVAPYTNSSYETKSYVLNDKATDFKLYSYQNTSDTISKEPYKYGVSTNGIIQINKIKYFIYSESNEESRPLFNTVINSIKLTKEI